MMSGRTNQQGKNAIAELIREHERSFEIKLERQRGIDLLRYDKKNNGLSMDEIMFDQHNRAFKGSWAPKHKYYPIPRAEVTL